MKVPFTQRILAGYVILSCIIASMAFILMYERYRTREIEAENVELQAIRRDIYAVYGQIMRLSISGESVIGWDKDDYDAYHVQRQRADSLLRSLKPRCGDFVHPSQVDMLRILLENKEKHLLRVMESLERREQADSLMASRLPDIVRKATRVRTVRRKKDNFWGKLGMKETVRVLPSAGELHAFSDSLTALQRKQSAEMEAYADSLRSRNRSLNTQLNSLISNLDRQTRAAFKEKEQKIRDAQNKSVKLFTVTLSVAIILLFLSYLAIHREIRRRIATHKKMRQLLDEYNGLLKMYKKTLLTVSHDIRGPLNVINNYVKWAMGAKSKKDRDTFLRNVRHSYSHILRLVNNLLDVFRLNEAKDIRNDIPFHLSTLLERIAAEYTLSAGDKGLLFSGRFDNTDVTVKGDADRLEQILDNLLANAVKFTKNGSVTLVAGYRNGTLDMRVTDTGIGMDEETRKRIFIPFEQGAPEMNAGGFGLGLSIVAGAVRLMEGKITVESHPGKGSTFYVTLPMPLTEEETEYEAEPDTGAEELPELVLAIEDDPLQLELCREMLERNGVRCTACAQLEQLVDKMCGHDYDLILTDIQMSGTDGFGLLKLLRESDIGNSKTIPVIAMTARGEYDAEHFREAGFAGHVYKPYSWPELRSALCKVRRISPDKGKTDFSLITEEAQDGAKTLEMLIAETRENMEGLNDALRREDREGLRWTAHRMQSLWDMLGKGEAIEDYREILNDENADSQKIKEQTVRILGLCRQLLEEARSELRSRYGKYTDR